MEKRLLIDAVHPEEIRVAALDGERLVTVDVDTREGDQLAGNLYVASVARVEASLQAAFVDYGGDRHGFLPFSEIHPDYYQLPEVEASLPAASSEAAPETEDGEPADGNGPPGSGGSEDGAPEEPPGPAAPSGRRERRKRSYAIQEVIRNRQIMLVQVHKEPRGDKGAVLTTYISLAGRYCVLMPNADRGGGVSRKISAEDRKRLREIAGELDVPRGHGVIIRTAGCSRTRPEIKRDYAALLKQWDEIRAQALESVAPTLIHAESNLIRRAVRDLYDRETAEILIEGEQAYQEARRQMRMLTPSHVKYVRQYNKTPRGAPLPPDSRPIFDQFGIERQLEELYSPRVTLPSGGSIVISPSEALTAIDVNSGRSTGERNIEETAYRTNLEAADVVARQLRLRDISGLVVIDFIDMVEERNRHAVERRLRDRLRSDYSRTQVGKISAFGLLEMSRQRLARSLVEMSTIPCRDCDGAGRTRSPVSLGLSLLRRVEAEAGGNGEHIALIRTPSDVAEFLTNQKRAELGRIETRRGIRIHVRPEGNTASSMSEVAWRSGDWDPLAESLKAAREAPAETSRERRRRRGRAQDGQRARGADAERDAERSRVRRGRRGRARSTEDAEAARSDRETVEPQDTAPRGRKRRRASENGGDADAAPPVDAPDTGGGEEDSARRRRRGRRGGRRRLDDGPGPESSPADAAENVGASEEADRGAGGDEKAASGAESARRRRRGRRGGRGRSQRRPDSADTQLHAGAAGNGGAPEEGSAPQEMPMPRVEVSDDFARADVYDPRESVS